LLWTHVAGSVFLVLFCLSRSFPLSLALMIPVGASNTARYTLANSQVQLIAQNEFHGRVMSIFSLLFSGMSQAGALVLGAVAEGTGAPWAIGIGAVASVILGLMFVWRMPYVRRLP
jgi:predicted MFS family arabinose efflux permease